MVGEIRPSVRPAHDAPVEVAEIRLRLTYRRLPGVTASTAEIVRDLAAQCEDFLPYQHKDNEDAYCVVETVEVVQ